MKHYIVYIPGKEQFAKVIAAETSWEARKVVSAVSQSGLSPHDLVAFPKERIAFLGPRVRNAFPPNVRD